MTASNHQERIGKQSETCFGDSLTVAQFILSSLLASFAYLLKVKSLSKHIPVHNAKQLHTLNQQCVAYFYLQGESTNKTLIITEDSMPKTIPKDAMVSIASQPLLKQDSCQLTISQGNNQSLLLPLKIDTPYSLSYSLSKGSGMGSGTYHKVEEFKMSSQIINNSSAGKAKNFKQRPQQSSIHSHSHSIPLTFPSQKQQPDPAEQRQLQYIKKNLYTMRRYRRISIEQQRQSIDRLNKKKSHLLLGTKVEHTYDYDGNILEKRNVRHNRQQINNITELHTNIGGFPNRHTLKRNQSSLNKKTKNLIELNSSSFFEQLPTNSQNKQHNLQFNNFNKRQVSHLPFISLRDNSKIIENNSYQLSGSVTERTSLNRRKLSQLQSNNNNDASRRFKFFSQIELEKKNVQRSQHKALNEQSAKLLQIGILPQTLLNKNNPQHEQPYQKRSKIMQKYLLKLTEQKRRIQKEITEDSNNLKSLNFNQLAVPQKYPIQRYYEYDFEGEIKSYEYSISSKLSTKRNSLSLANQTQPNC